MGNKNNPLSREASEGYCVNRAGGVYNPPSCRFPPLREGNRAARPFGSPCSQGEP
jgi:hypothetical protein